MKTLRHHKGDAAFFVLWEPLCVFPYNNNGGITMEPKDYIITKIEGEYAYLKDTESENEIFIALALLPPGSDIGSKIHSEMFEYSLKR